MVCMVFRGKNRSKNKFLAKKTQPLNLLNTTVMVGFWAIIDDVLHAINSIHDKKQIPEKLISKITENR